MKKNQKKHPIQLKISNFKKKKKTYSEREKGGKDYGDSGGEESASELRIRGGERVKTGKHFAQSVLIKKR